MLNHFCKKPLWECSKPWPPWPRAANPPTR